MVLQRIFFFFRGYKYTKSKDEAKEHGDEERVRKRERGGEVRRGRRGGVGVVGNLREASHNGARRTCEREVRKQLLKSLVCGVSPPDRVQGQQFTILFLKSVRNIS